jgi:hypothetical protein
LPATPKLPLFAYREFTGASRESTVTRIWLNHAG